MPCSIPPAIGPMNEPMDMEMDCKENTVPSLFPPLRSMNIDAIAGKVTPFAIPSMKSDTCKGTKSRAAIAKNERAMPRMPNAART